MLEQRIDNGCADTRNRFGLIALCTTLLVLSAGAHARPVDVTVRSENIEGDPIPQGFRWVLQEDVTYESQPDTTNFDPDVGAQLSTNLHKSHLPVIASGDCPARSVGPCTLTVDDNKRYYLSVLPDLPAGADEDTCQTTRTCYTMSGRQILADINQTRLPVVVTSQPLPTAQIYIMAHADVAPINNAWDAIEFEPGLGGFDVIISDFTGGILSVDNYGNPLGTRYKLAADGLTPEVDVLGDGTIHTMTEEEVGDPLRNPYGLRVGEALVKNLAPGKYAVNVEPPQGTEWQQTSTIEGSRTIDAWVRAGEPRFYSEFARRGPIGHHATFGFVRPQAFAELTPGPDTGTIIGQNMSLGFRRVPDTGFDLKPPTGISPCYIGLNDQTNISQGIYAGSCNDDDSFTIENVPAGTYLVMIFDRYLGNIFNAQSVTVVAGETTDMGEIGTFRWFSTLENWSFYDANEDGIWQRDVEPPLDEQAALLRYRDGSIYQESATDFDGFVPFDEIFPWFNWLVAEIDFARYKHTGTTVTVENGGTPLDGDIGEGKRNPQIQDPADGGTNCGMVNGTGQEGCLTRTETGPALLEGYNHFLGFNSRIEWGKKEWEEGENGGLSGVVFYATTRAEDDVRYAAAEPWEPGVPRVQVNLYRSDNEGNIDATVAGDPGVVDYADMDNYPLGWSDPDDGTMGPEDKNNNFIGDAPGCAATLSCAFNVGDAVEYAHTDSFDDSPPTDCPADSNTWGVAPVDPLHLPPGGPGTETQFNGRCYDSLRNFNQVRPAVFDGGFGLGAPWTGMDDVDNAPTGNFPGDEDIDHDGDGVFDDVDYLPAGYYVVEIATPAGYIATASGDKNVDHGDTFTINPLALPPICVGDEYTIDSNAVLNLFPEAGIPAPFRGTTRRMCDRKLVQITDGKNMAADFFLHTETPVAGQFKGFAINDLANEFDFQNPNAGEKWAPPNIPVSIRDHAGNEVYRTTTDKYGQYNVVVPSSFRINTPMASGVSANMAELCLNAPFKENPYFNPDADAHPVNNPRLIEDPFYNKQFSQFCWTFNSHAGLTTYLDTPLFAISAFSGPNNWQLDCEYPTLTPVIQSVSVANGIGGGPYVPPNPTPAQRVITITSAGMTEVPDPNAARVEGENTTFIMRDFGFGLDGANSSVTINGVELTDVTWTDAAISATIPAGVTTGQLEVTRDNGVSTVVGVTVIIDDGSIPAVNVVGPGVGPMFYETIQEAIDMTPDNGVVLVSPGQYLEGLFVTKPIQLQGWGPNVTTILSALSPSSRLQEWREKANFLVNCSEEIGLLPSESQLFEGPDPLPPGAEPFGEAQFNNQPNIAAPCGHTPGTGLFRMEEAPGILVAPREGIFDGTSSARIDGFTITGAINSHGIYVNGYANFQEISNNRITGNQGKSGAGGIRVGLVRERAVHPASNHSEFVNIHHNDISENSSLVGPGGGLLITRGADNYRITNNYVCGNFVAGDGAGIAHFGRINDGLIADNKVLFNHSFAQPPGLGTNGGGILVSGQGERVIFEPQLPEVIQFVATAGSGNVKVLRNLIQGNNAGSGDGGGLALANLNGQDVIASTDQDTWHRVDVLNNIIVNNVAGMTGGGVSIKDGLKVSLVNNTIMNNDSTATAFNAFDGCLGGTFPTLSCPKPAGISAWAHSTSLLDTGGAVGTFSNPTMFNNIVLGNRSQYWEVTPTGPGGTDVGALEIEPGPSDYGVYPPGTGTLMTSNSVVSVGTLGADVIDGGDNTEVDATIPAGPCPASPAAGDGQCTIVLNSYHNVPPTVTGVIQPDGTIYGFSEFPADAKIAFDEGGNAIDVHYGPLTPGGDHHLQTGNPAVNAALSAGATPSASMYPARSPDFDREERPICTDGPDDCAYDIGADEVESANGGGTGGGPGGMYFSTQDSSAVPGVAGTPDDADIYFWDGTLMGFSRVFDASAAGLPGNADITALMAEDDDTFYMSFIRDVATQGGTTVPGVGVVDDSDIVKFDAGVFSLFFDGSDVGLSGHDNEDIDAFDILADGSVIVSTRGGASVPGVSGESDEDLLRCVGSFGPNTICVWTMYVEGSDISLNGGNDEDVDGASMTAGDIYLTTRGNYDTGSGNTGDRTDVFACESPTTGTSTSCGSFSKFFDGSDNGLSDNIDGIQVLAGSGVDPGGNQAPTVLDPAPGGTLTAYVGQSYGYQVVALDPNGDSPIGYSLCDGPSGGACVTPGFMSINGNGLISITASVAATDSGPYHLIVTDPFGATGTSDFTLDVVAPNAPVANDDFFDVTVPGQWVLPWTSTAEGQSLLQANDFHPDEALHGAVVRQLVTVPGQSQLQPEGSGFISIDQQSINPDNPELPILSSFEFTPQPGFVGTATFEYSLTNNSGTDTATVTLFRPLEMNNARYEPTAGMYHFEGFGISNGEVLTISIGPRDDVDNDPIDFSLGSPPGPEDFDYNGNGVFETDIKIPVGTATVTAGAWSLDVAGSPPASFDLIDVKGTVVTPPSTIVHQITDAPFLSTSAAGEFPLSAAFVQCPGDTDGDAVIDVVDPEHPNAKCVHLGAGDGFTRLGDGRELYGFSFSDLTGIPENRAIDKGVLNAQFPAPTLDFDQGDEVYLTLTNVNMLVRPDLFDPHTVHWHGFPNAAAVFDGLPDASLSINGGFSFTYYYNVAQPGTYMYHCHVEATEHMQMGMLGNLYVRPEQDGTTMGGYDTFVYNDGDGSTGYDVVVPIQIGSFDSDFHDASFLVQPLPFAEMHDDYPMLNGRGYPDTVNPLPIPPNSGVACGPDDENCFKSTSGVTSAMESSNKEHALVEATVGDKILLRISNLNVTQYNTLATTGLTMQVVGTGAHILRGPGGTDLYYDTASVTLGGGETADVLIDTTGVTPGTYLLYTTNLNNLSNGTEDFGGIMTEIRISATP